MGGEAGRRKALTPNAFVEKWGAVADTPKATERAHVQAHFVDLCELLNEPKPQDVDPTGETYGFEVGVKKTGGGDGWADVYRQGCFGWEYKKPRGDLKKAHDQLKRYADALLNPPYLVVSDIRLVRIHTNWTNTVSSVYEIELEELLQIGMRQRMRAVLTGSDELKPKETRQDLTQKVAEGFVRLAEELRAEGHPAHVVAHFVNRLVFCMFAEDTGILPKGLFTRMLGAARQDPGSFPTVCAGLFGAMARKGGYFGPDRVEWVNGGLFEDATALPLTVAQLDRVLRASTLQWDEVDPAILGTLFERGLDPAKRGGLGAHYTDAASIERIVTPVVIAPLEREWEAVKAEIKTIPVPSVTERVRYANAVERRSKPFRLFRERLKGVRVLDPACGSGNFLYVALRALRDFELRVVREGEGLLIPPTILELGPENVLGIELNEFAAELARVSVWIGDLQWSIGKGFGFDRDPVLGTLSGIERRDALLNPDGGEAVWPEAEFIVGNPPFLGGKLLRSGLGDPYVERVYETYKGRVARESDLCVYWFEKARAAIEAGKTRRAGLIATQGIRGGANRAVLARIKETGDIFYADSDRPWILDGAAVHISIVAQDDGSETRRILNGEPVAEIHPNLTAESALHAAKPLPANRDVCFMGTTKGNTFDVEMERARTWLHDPNPHGRPNSDVLVPWYNGSDVTGRDRGMWIIDFGVAMPLAEASLYEGPFLYVEQFIRPIREQNKRASYAEAWWRQVEPRPAMRAALDPLSRYLVTPRVTKHRLFAWRTAPAQPDSQVFAFAVEDDFTFGVLQSRFHEAWARAQGTQLREVESGFRYTPTTCFETFPFPAPTEAQREAIADAARALDRLRESWLNPPEWTREEVLTFPATVGGPWHRHIADLGTPPPPPQSGTERRVAEARYVRRVAKPAFARELKARTLTNLYNALPAWLRVAHAALDAAVAEAYGLDPNIPIPALLAALLERNLAP